MSVFTPSAAAAVGGALHRGLPTRQTNLMELFQESIVGAIAAAAGCNVGVPRIDNGIDLDLTHEMPNDEDAMLRVQLKAVSSGWNADNSKISAKMHKTRYNKMRRLNPSLAQIIVIMDLPANQEEWIRSEHPFTLAQHLCYWANLAGEPEFRGAGDMVTVSATADNVFDDVALCQIMARIRAGGAP